MRSYLRHRPGEPHDHHARAARRGDRQGRPVLHRQDPARARRGDRRPALAGESADLLGRALRGHRASPTPTGRASGARARSPAASRRPTAAGPSATGWASSRSRASPCTAPRRTGSSSTSRRTAPSTSTTPRPYLGKGNFEAQDMLHKKYGKKVTIALCGPVGEYQGLLGGISFSDKDGRPARLSARGGVGAVMGSKKVKAIVVDLDRIPPFHEARRRSTRPSRTTPRCCRPTRWSRTSTQKIGTMGMADLQNTLGGLPVRNFSAGQQVDVATGEKFKMGGDYISQLNVSRGGEHTHACMPGCVIQCSNVYHDAGRQGSGLAGRVRDPRPARHQLRPQRPRRPGPDELPRQRPRRGHHRARAPPWPC